MSGSLIVIEGIDGSGKGTQARLLVEYLAKHQIPHFYVDFPDYESFYGHMVAQFLRGEYGSIDNTSPYLISLLYALDRRESSAKIKEALNSGKIVVANRYATSNMAHQGSKFTDKTKREAYMKWVDQLEYEINHIPREHIVIYLKVSPELSRELTHRKDARGYLNGKKKDIHEEDDQHLIQTARTYEMLSQTYSHWVTLECMDNGTMKSVDEIQQDIKKILQDSSII